MDDGETRFGKSYFLELEDIFCYVPTNQPTLPYAYIYLSLMRLLCGSFAIPI